MNTERIAAGQPAPAPLGRPAAEQYAAWFRALGDTTRIQIVSVLASQDRALPVGEIVTAVGLSQPTVSQHLKILTGIGFLVSERHGTARHYGLNHACVAAFPTAAGLVVGRRPPAPERPEAYPAPAAQPASGRAAQAGDPGEVHLRPMESADAARVLAIYQAGLDSGQASFETHAPTWERFDATRLTGHRHVAVSPGGDVLGWVAASPVSDRCVYAGVAEHSVYVDPAARRHGIGAALLQALIRSTEAAGIWTVQSGIFPENTASLRLHEQAGFRVVGTRRRIGCHRGRWRDVILVERRSPRTGTG